jgi:hypothetical protein
MFRDNRPCVDRYECRRNENRCEDERDLASFRCHVFPLWVRLPWFDFWSETGKKAVMPITL